MMARILYGKAFLMSVTDKQRSRQPSAATAPQAASLRNVLLLQGGGALGAYQAGAYEALAEHAYDPD